MPSELRYSALPTKRSFRLLKLLNCDQLEQQPGTRLNCALDVYDLDRDVPEYVAFSYTWDSPIDDPEVSKLYGRDHDLPIMVSHDGRPPLEHYIGRNLHEGLTQTYKTQWSRLMWADSICINQADPEERASQVQLMCSIYSNTKYTLAWLGYSTPNLVDILWFYGPFCQSIMQWREAGQDREDAFPSLECCDASGPVEEWTVCLNEINISMAVKKLVHLCGFFNTTRFFNRLWVLQELFLPPKVVALLGPNILDFGMQDVLLGWLDPCMTALTIQMPGVLGYVQENVTLPLPRPAPQVAAEVSNADGYSLIPRLYGATTPKTRGLAYIEFILASKGSLATSDPRDQIFSLLGCVERRVADSSVEILRPDYSLTMYDLLHKLTARLLTELPYMTALALRPSSRHSRIHGLPSWFLDPTTSLATDSLAGYQFFGTRVPFDAYPTRKIEYRALEIEDGVLKAWGHRCGEIEKYGINNEFPNPLGNQEAGRLPFQTYVLTIACEIGPFYPWDNNESVFDSIIQTITLGWGKGDRDLTSSIVRGFWTEVKHLHEALLHLTNSPIENERTREWAREHLEQSELLVANLKRLNAFPPSAPSLESSQWTPTFGEMQAHIVEDHQKRVDLEEFMERRRVTMNKRVMFRTNNNFIGLASDDIQPGDQVWLLCRARVPLVLRPQPDGTFVTLGEAYVHRGMRGELIERGVAGSLTQVSIV